MSSKNSKVYFITHPNVVIDKDVPVPQWPLSEKGIQRMIKMLSKNWIKDITAVYTSNEQKAIDGAEILAKYLGIDYRTLHDLGENDRSSTGFLPKDQFEKMADAFFSFPDSSIKGWEKAQDAQNRIYQAVLKIIETDLTNGSIAIVSHGGVGALLLCKLANLKISKEHDQPGEGGGNYFVFDRASLKIITMWEKIDSDG